MRATTPYTGAKSVKPTRRAPADLSTRESSPTATARFSRTSGSYLMRVISLLAAFCMLAIGQQSLATLAARPRPDLEQAAVYQVWMRAFTPQGTLQATAARLPYIAALGASIVYLSPLQTAST